MLCGSIKRMDRKHNGATAELRAQVWLLEQGYEVYENVSQHGPVDLVAEAPDGTLTRIDVTTGRYYVKQSGEVSLQFAHKKDRPPGIRVLVVLPDGQFHWHD